jgi:hypothetical protein
LPKRSENPGRRQQQGAGSQIEPAISRSQQGGRRQIRDQSLFRALGRGHEQAVKGEQRPQQQRRTRPVQAEEQIKRGVHDPAGDDHANAADAVGKARQMRGKQHGDQRSHAPQQGNLVFRQTRLARAQQKKHVRGVAQGE